jgi:hypothetical protein
MKVDARLRQVALVARELEPVVERLQHELGLDNPYRDPGVGTFGLENAVFAAGDTFLEIVSPVQPDTTAGRYLDRRGGDSGYMAIFQVPDIAEARQRIADLGVRVVWKADFPDVAGTHLHPKDMLGAIVSIDWANPPGSWPGAGPMWTGAEPPHPPGGITGLTVEVARPRETAERWAAVLGVTETASTRHPDEMNVPLDCGRQTLRFAPLGSRGADGITGVTLAATTEREIEVGGVRFTVVPVEEKGRG